MRKKRGRGWRIPMSKLREVIRLAEECALSQRQISAALGVSRPVVAQYLGDFRASGMKYGDIREMPDDKLLGIFTGRKNRTQKPRYKAMSGTFPAIGIRLKEKGETLQRLWQEYIARHPDGYSYSQFCYHYQVWREADAVTMHVDYKAGEKMLVDFTGDRLEVTDPETGRTRQVEVFVAILGASQLTYVEAVETQRKEDWVKANAHALKYFGGTPRAIVPDCLGSAVTDADYYEPDINPDYADFAGHYGTVILPARPGRAKDKALVENAVRIAYTRIFAPLRRRVFHSLDELNGAIMELLEEHNRKPFQRLGVSRRELFDEVERDRLKPLPVKEYEVKQFRTLKVQFNYHVYLSEDKHYYSVPYRYVRKDVKVVYTSDTVEVFYRNVRIALHRRDRQGHGYTTVAEHMPPNHRYYANPTPERILRWASGAGESAHDFIEGLLDRGAHPEQAYRSCLGVLSLGKKYGEERLDAACRRAVDLRYYSYRAVRNILKHGLDRIKEAPPLAPLPAHENLRGSSYYG